MAGRFAAPAATLDARNSSAIAALECGVWHPRIDRPIRSSIPARALSDWWRGRRVLIVSAGGGASRRYRCEYRAEQLALAGAEVELRTSDDPGERWADGVDCVLLHRVGWRRRLEAELRLARSCRTPVLYETDDLLFEPGLAGDRSYLPELGDEERRGKFEGHRRTLAAADGATVSTEPLAERARRVDRRVAVLPNVAGEELVHESDRALAAVQPHAGVTLAYFSGTPTHDHDFLEAADAVAAALDRAPDVRLLTVGPLELDPRFDAFGDRIERIEFVPYAELPALIARADVSLAPLEPDNPFTEAKSAIKYVEAGLVGVPTVASAEPDFVRVVRDGENGFLARSREDWRAAVFRLVEDERLRCEVGRRAFEDVRANHTARARAAEHAAVLADLIERARPGRVAGAAAGARLRLRRRTG